MTRDAKECLSAEELETTQDYLLRYLWEFYSLCFTFRSVAHFELVFVKSCKINV